MSACGGGDGGGSIGPTGPAPGHPYADRIEPLDPRTSTRAAGVLQAKSASAPIVSQLPATSTPTLITLPALEAQALRTRMKSASADFNAQRGTGALQVGFARAVTQTARDIGPLLRSQTLGDGSRVAALTLNSTGALGIRIPAIVHSLPAGSTLRWLGRDQSGHAEQYSSDEIQSIQAEYRAMGLTDEQALTLHGPIFDGPAATLEVHIPAGSQVADVRIAMSNLQHLWIAPDDAITGQARRETEIGLAEPCHINAMCHACEFQRRAVAKYFISYSNGNMSVCTGTLLNNTRDDQTPYFATAWHCVNDNATVASVRSFWFFHAQSCDANTVNRDWKEIGGWYNLDKRGAQVLWTNVAQDFTLLELKNIPPRVTFSGSYIGTNARGIELSTIHGGLAKVQPGQGGEFRQL